MNEQLFDWYQFEGDYLMSAKLYQKALNKYYQAQKLSYNIRISQKQSLLGYKQAYCLYCMKNYQKAIQIYRNIMNAINYKREQYNLLLRDCLLRVNQHLWKFTPENNKCKHFRQKMKQQLLKALKIQQYHFGNQSLQSLFTLKLLIIVLVDNTQLDKGIQFFKSAWKIIQKNINNIKDKNSKKLQIASLLNGIKLLAQVRNQMQKIKSLSEIFNEINQLRKKQIKQTIRDKIYNSIKTVIPDQNTAYRILELTDYFHYLRSQKYKNNYQENIQKFKQQFYAFYLTMFEKGQTNKQTVFQYYNNQARHYSIMNQSLLQVYYGLKQFDLRDFQENKVQFDINDKIQQAYQFSIKRQWKKAIQKNQQALKLALNIFKNGDQTLTSLYLQIGKLYYYIQNKQKSKQFYSKGQKCLQQSQSKYNFQTYFHHLSQLGRYFDRSGQPKKALKYYEKSLKEIKSHFGQNDYRTLQLQKRLKIFYERFNEQLSENYASKNTHKQKYLFESQNYSIAKGKYKIAKKYQQCEQWENTLFQYEQIIQLLEKDQNNNCKLSQQLLQEIKEKQQKIINKYFSQ